MPKNTRRKELFSFYLNFLRETHSLAVEEEGSIVKTRDEGTLNFIAEGAIDKGRSLTGLASYLLFSIATRHPFFDGNKRTATLCALSILHIEEEFSKIKGDSEYEKFILAVAEYKLTEAKVRKYLKRRFNK